MQRSVKRKLVIGLTALAVVGLAGGAYAATQSSAPPSRQAFLNDVAKRLGVTPQQLSSALSGAALDQLQAAVKSGRLTQAQANALAQRLKQNGAPLPGVPLPVPFGFGPHLERPWPGGHRGPGGGPGGGFGGGFALRGGFGDISAAASYLGLTAPQLFQQLSSGKSLAQIATSRGKTVSGLEQAMTTAMKTRLDKLVARKVITVSEEQQILSRFSKNLSQVVNQKGLPFPHGMPAMKPGQRFPNGALPKLPRPPASAPLPAPAAPVA